MRTRIAPTPSGFLHAGNAVNFVLVSWLARAENGTVILRIDDMDRDRYRREYVDDIFSMLDWLDIDIDEGPSTTSEFESNFSMRHHIDWYREGLERLRSSRTIETYACSCSRHDLANGRVCTCRDRGLALAPHQTALRVRVPQGFDELLVTMGDFVVWRRDDTAAYQLASVIEDEALGVTHIVRGEDLAPSTHAQRLLAPALDAMHFELAVVLHHSLVKDALGGKLSKSQLRGGPMPRTPEQRAFITETAVALAGELGVDVP